MIKLLPKETIDKIAAGEVVENPRSVVKELVENSIDAGASLISVEIKDGGISYIRVTDNGCGIERADIEAAFMRHSTSKITSEEDLYRLSTLGFRGEALSSISAVSKTTLITKTKDSDFGYLAKVQGGSFPVIEETGAPEGSTFIIEDLFFNTPPRKKFLKSPKSEATSVTELMEHLALSNPSVSFKLLSGGREVLYTGGSGDLKTAIYEIFGRETAGSLLYINKDLEGFSLRGYLGKSIINRGNRGGETFFVNNRFVKDEGLSKAVEEGYRGYLMLHAFPFFVLFLDFPGDSFDVNVHPSKTRVRFDDENLIREALREAVRERLTNREDIEKIALVREEIPLKKEPHYEPFEIKSMGLAAAEAVEEESLEELLKEASATVFEELENSEPEDLPEEEMPEPVFAQESFVSYEARPNHRIIGQAFGTYWIMEYNETLYLIDQHAAHEKVLFEGLMKKIREGRAYSQQILSPEIISLSLKDEEALLNCKESVESLGFNIEHFGERDYKITGVPAGLPVVDPKELLFEIINDNSSGGVNTLTERVASIACKAAVKGSHLMSEREINALMDELLNLDNPYHCPHGRPTMISFTRYELDKKFRRIV